MSLKNSILRDGLWKTTHEGCAQYEACASVRLVGEGVGMRTAILIF